MAGALCFVAEPGERACDSPARCSEVMHAERQQLFRRINELSAADGGSHAELYAALERDFANPEHLLGGDGDQ